jgi:RNA polymerase sigma-70 factor (ECF subfamily)
MPNDKEIMLRISKNDFAAIEQLYDRYANFLYSIIIKIIKDTEMSEKILSDIFIIIWRWAEHFESNIPNVFTWIVILTRNKIFDVLKRKSNDIILQNCTEEYEVRYILPKLSPKIDDIDFETAQRMTDKVIFILNNLTSEQQKIINSAYFEGLSEKAIAEKFNIPVATIRLNLQLIIEIISNKLFK